MTAGRARSAALAALATLLACSSPESKLEDATALRRAGQPRAALQAYKALLADLGEGPLPEAAAGIRSRALRAAGDLSYLELGDYTGAISYYRRIVSLQPGAGEAYEARGIIGDIYRDRLNDRLAAIAQYAEVASSESPLAPRYQLEVARCYLALGRYDQARNDARILRERWPKDELADEAQLLAAQALALDRKDEEAIGAFQALIDRRPKAKPEVLARALEGEAHIYAQAGRFDRAIELYSQALPDHPNPDAIRTNIESVRGRREKAKISMPGDRAAAFDENKGRRSPREAP